MVLMNISPVSCCYLTPSLGILALKSMSGSTFAIKILMNFANSLDFNTKSQLVSDCKKLIQLRNLTSSVLRKSKEIVRNLESIEIETE
jgi:hypothetical protein